MIGSSAANTCTASAHTAHDILIRNIYINGIVYFLSQTGKRFVKSLCLRDCSRESIKYITCLLYTSLFINKKEALLFK